MNGALMAEDETKDADLVTEKEPVKKAPSSFAAIPVTERMSQTKTSHDGGPLGAYEALARSARLPDLVAIATAVVGDAAAQHATSWSFVAKVTAAAEEAKLSRPDADTPYGNALKVLESGPEGEAERSLASALWAHALAESARKDEDKAAGDLLWLATHTAFDALPLVDRALGEDATDIWRSIADRVKRIDEGRGGALGRAEGLVGVAALAASKDTDRLKQDLAGKIGDPVMLRVLAVEKEINVLRFEGEAISAPRGPVATTFLALTGLLFVIHGVRLVARLALAYRRPAEVTMTDSGIRVKSRTEMLGKTIREHEDVIVRAGLVRVTREVRYPRAAFYAGLLALALGSYVGVRAFADGVRSASPSLLLVGLVIVAIGIGLDFVLGSVIPSSRGRIRVAFVPRSGRTLCVGDVEAARADDVIKRTFG